jgi:hypothetical protein
MNGADSKNDDPDFEAEKSGSDSTPPESPPPREREHSSSRDRDRDRDRDPSTRRRRLEGVIPEIVRRAVELGVEKAVEAPDNFKQFAQDIKLPKEIAHVILSQIDETKNGLFRVVAKEIRDFLEHTNFAGEMQKLLTTVQFEVNTTIRFTPNDGKSKGGKKSEPPPSGETGAKSEDGESSSNDESSTSSERPTPLPKPEVRTNVHVRRDGRRRD